MRPLSWLWHQLSSSSYSKCHPRFKKIHSDPIHWKQPLCPIHFNAFLHLAICSQSYHDLLFITILSCAFYACHQIGELIPPSSHSLPFNWWKIIKWSSLHFDNLTVNYNLPYHKGDSFYWGTDIIIASQNIVNPVVLLCYYTHLQDNLHGSQSPLFLWENRNHPSQSWFEQNSLLYSIILMVANLLKPVVRHSMQHWGYLNLSCKRSDDDLLQLGKFTSVNILLFTSNNNVLLFIFILSLTNYSDMPHISIFLHHHRPPHPPFNTLI